MTNTNSYNETRYVAQLAAGYVNKFTAAALLRYAASIAQLDLIGESTDAYDAETGVEILARLDRAIAGGYAVADYAEGLFRLTEKGGALAATA